VAILSFNSKTLLKVLPYLRGDFVDLPTISIETGVPYQTIREILEFLKEEGCTTEEGGCFRCLKGATVSLAIEAIKAGASFEEVLKAVGWQDFESFVDIVLAAYGYKTFKNYRLKKPRIEVDVFARRGRVGLLIDCKQWHKILSPSNLEHIVRKQIDRAKSLLAYDSSLPRDLILIPVVVTLLPSYVKCYEGVPVVACGALKSFVGEVEGRMEEFVKVSLEDGDVYVRV